MSGNTLTLAIENDGIADQTVDLSALDQDIDGLAFNNSTNVLTVGITDGTSQTVDLSDLDNSGTDDQTLAEVTAQGSSTTDTIQVGGIFDNGLLVVSGESSLQGDVNLGDASSDTISFNGAVDTSIFFDATGKDIGSTSIPATTIYSDGIKPGSSNDLSINTNSTSERINFSNNNVITAGVNSSTLFIGDISGPSYYSFPSGAEMGAAGQVLTVSSTTNFLYFTDADSGTDSQTLTASALSGNNTMTLAISDGNTVTLDLSSLGLPAGAAEGVTLRWNATDSAWEASSDLKIAPGTGYSPTDALWIEKSILPSPTSLDLGQSGNGFDKVYANQLLSSTKSVTFGTTNGSNKVYLKFEGNPPGTLVLNDLASSSTFAGSNNTAFGFRTLTNPGASVNNNTAIGFGVMDGGSATGNDNVGVGYYALGKNVASDNVAIGSTALYENSSGTQNIAIGSNALDTNTIGQYNQAIGFNALTRNVDGEDNVAIGKNSMETNTTGDKNVAIGNSANVGSNNLENAIAIGYGATVNSSNTIRLGNAAISSMISSGTLTLDGVTYPNTTGTAGQVLTVSSTTNMLYFADAASGSSTPTLAQVTSQGTITTDNIQVGGMTVSGTIGLTLGEGASQYSFPTTRGGVGQSLIVSTTASKLVFSSPAYLLASYGGTTSIDYSKISNSAPNEEIAGFEIEAANDVQITTTETTSDTIKLPAGKSFKLTAHIFFDSQSSSVVNYRFYDQSGTKYIGMQGSTVKNSSNYSIVAVPAVAYIEASTSSIEVRIAVISYDSGLSTNDDVDTDLTRIEVEEIK